MGIYKLNKKAGSHVGCDINGVEVEVLPGQKIETDSDLSKSFPNKFVRLDNVMDDDQAQGFAQPTIPVPGRFIKGVTADKIDSEVTITSDDDAEITD